jgi:hypothetical protein
MRNNKMKFYGIFVLFFSFLSLNGQTRILEVPFITQAPHGNWCWAASCAMASTYYGNNSSMCGIVEWTRLNLTKVSHTGKC